MRIDTDCKIEILRINGVVTITQYFRTDDSEDWRLYEGQIVEIRAT